MRQAESNHHQTQVNARRKQVDRLAQVLHPRWPYVPVVVFTSRWRRSWKRIGRTFAVGQSFMPQRGQGRRIVREVRVHLDHHVELAGEPLAEAGAVRGPEPGLLRSSQH